MTLAELKAYIASQLVAPVTLVQKIINCFNAVIDFIVQNDQSGIPAWTNALTFNNNGTGAGAFCTYPDVNGKLRLWNSKTNGNIGNQPPTAVDIDENTFWKEVSPASGSAIKEWAPGIFGAGLVIVYYDVSGEGKALNLFLLNVGARPFNSVNFLTELAAGQWKQLSGSDLTQYNSADAPIIIDLLHLKERKFRPSAVFAAAKTFQYNNTTNATEFTIFFEINTLTAIITFPALTTMSDARWEVTGANEWQANDIGKYKAKVEFDGTNYTTEITGPYN